MYCGKHRTVSHLFANRSVGIALTVLYIVQKSLQNTFQTFKKKKVIHPHYYGSLCPHISVLSVCVSKNKSYHHNCNVALHDFASFA